MSETADILTADERERLARYEATIERGRQAYIDVGAALDGIREERLYRQDYATFDEYCRKRWGFSRFYAHRLIDAREVARLLPIGNTPSTESQARELAPLRDKPETLRVVWSRAKERAGGQPSAKDIRAERFRVVHTQPADTPPPSPTGVSRDSRVTAHIVKRSLLANIEQLAPLVPLLSAEDRESLARELHAFTRLLRRAP